MDTKEDVLEMLRDLAELTMLDEGDPQSFRVRAYEQAAQAVATHAMDLGRLQAKDLQKIPGIGKGTAEKIVELIHTGKVEKLETLRQKYPRAFVALLRVPGLGPKAVIKLRTELGIESMEDLRRAIAEQRIRSLKGFGAKSEEKIGQALQRLDAQGASDRTPISVALPHAERIVSSLRALAGVQHVTYTGSLRRFAETIGDIDIMVSGDDPGLVMEAVASANWVERIIVRGDTKTSVVTKRGIQVDVRVVAPSQLGAALIYFTGSKAHNIKLRQRAIARGWTLNEYALTDTATGRVLASETEEDVYRALGMAWVPPVLREDTGEVEAAEAGRLPAPMGAIRGDFHVHTNVSGDGRSSLDDMVTVARQRGYSVLAITEHAEGTLSGVGREALLAQRDRIRQLQTACGDDLLIIYGVELNIGPQGELDFDAEFRRAFDWCLASVHSHFDLDRATQTKRIVTAMQDPSVRMIGHLTARMIGARPPIDLDIPAVLHAAEETNTALEINGALPRLDVPVDVLRMAKGRNVTFVLTSDAHHTDELALIEHAARHAERAWLDRQCVANTWTPDKLRAWAKGA